MVKIERVVAKKQGPKGRWSRPLDVLRRGFGERDQAEGFSYVELDLVGLEAMELDEVRKNARAALRGAMKANKVSAEWSVLTAAWKADRLYLGRSVAEDGEAVRLYYVLEDG